MNKKKRFVICIWFNGEPEVWNPKYESYNITFDPETDVCPYSQIVRGPCLHLPCNDLSDGEVVIPLTSIRKMHIFENLRKTDE